MTPVQRASILQFRQLQTMPWHSPPHWRLRQSSSQPTTFLISAACYEHAHYIGTTCDRHTTFTEDLLDVTRDCCLQVHAWCILTNHYHLLLETDRLLHLTRQLGRLHGRSSRTWNLQDVTPQRKVWHRASDRAMRTEDHFWTTINYVHHNPVRHGYVEKWTDWPWSSAHQYLEHIGREEAIRIWRNYPLRDYGKNWDE